MQQLILVCECVCVEFKGLFACVDMFVSSQLEETIVSLKSSHAPDSIQKLIMFLALS